MLHRVNKLQFEASCANEAEAFEVRSCFAQSCQDQVVAIIDKICSSYISADEWVHIPHIEVDLGFMDLSSFQNKLPDLFLARFEEEFSTKLKSLHTTGKTLSTQTSYLQILTCFLETGTLPWWADLESIDIIYVFENLAEEQPHDIRDFLLLHQQDQFIWERIALQFSHEIHQLLFTIFPVLASAERKLTEWSSLITSILQSQDSSRTPPFISPEKSRKFILLHYANFNLSEQGASSQTALVKECVNEFIQEHEVIFSTEELVKRMIAYEEKRKVSGEKVDFLVAEIKNGVETLPEFEIEHPLPEKFNIKTAGIVLLAAYFTQFFTRLHLLEKGEWKNKEAQCKAIHLTKYLATGQQNSPEYSLVFEKIICGWDINVPLEKVVPLSETEKEEAEELLKSIISNWTRIKNTSVDGLRETFLKRDGILTKKGNSWLLQVERKTPDVLLEAIPWNFSTLRFSWTNYIIATEW